MSIWTIPKSPAERWRAVIVVCETSILVLWAGAIALAVFVPADLGTLDYRAERAYSFDRVRAIAPIAYLTLGISVALGAVATYRRRFADGKEFFWPAILFVVLGLVLAQLVWPHFPATK